MLYSRTAVRASLSIDVYRWGSVSFDSVLKWSFPARFACSQEGQLPNPRSIASLGPAAMDRLQSRHWCFTLNNPDGPPDEFLDHIKDWVDYGVVGFEQGERGTYHLQGYFCLKVKNRLTWLRAYFSPDAHFEIKRGTPQQAADYCKKDGYFEEFGVLPLEQQVAGGNKRKAEFAEAYSLAKTQKVSDVEPELQIKYLHTLNKIADRELAIKSELDNTCGVWIYGPPGSGKTRFARGNYTERAEDVYLKLPNKWWDHYKGQDVVLMDDVDPTTCKYLVQYFKQWMDRYPFKCEYKGGARDIRPLVFLITSNYSIEECFPGQHDATAIRRRCDVIKFSDDHMFVAEV